MRAKKLILFVLLATLGTSAQAQIVSSQSNQVIVTQEVKPEKPKKPWNGKFYAKVELGSDLYTSADKNGDYGSALGYEAEIGLRSPIGKAGAIWGAEVGVMSTLADNLDYWYGKGEESGNAVFASPYIGWRLGIGSNTSIVPYIGPYFKMPIDIEDGDFRVGPSAGLELWFNKIAIGANYKWDDDNSKTGITFSLAF